MGDSEDEHPLLCPQCPSVPHREGPSFTSIDDWSPSTVDFLNNHTYEEEKWIHGWIDFTQSRSDYMMIERGN